MYSGDINQSGFIDLADLIPVSHDATNFVRGYVKTAINGDHPADLTDWIMVYSN